MTGASAAVWGYVSELERTMILGAAIATSRNASLNICSTLQTIAMEALAPGEALQRR